MRIKTQFTITVVLFGAILAAVGASLILTNRQVERLQKQEDIAHELELRARELSYLSNDYLLHGESQQRARWKAKFSSFSDLLSVFAPEGPETAALVNEIASNQERLRAIFTDVASTLENRPPAGRRAPDIQMIRVSWSRMEVQNQGMAFDASRLSRILEERADRLQRRRVILLFVLIGVFGTFLVINYVTVNRRILRDISDLQDGTRIIGSGNLEFAIEEKKADEIGDLSHAFNRMTADLKALTASKSDLEREMSERRQAEESLKESEARYRNLFENMTEEVHYWELVRDAAGRIKTWRLVDANPPTLNTWGRTSLDEIKGKTTDEILGPGATDHYLPVVRKIMTEGVPYSFVDYFSNLDKYFRFTNVPLGNHFLTTGADITGIKKAEEQLRKTLESIGDGFFACDADWRFVYVNAPAERILAIRREEVLGRSHWEVFPLTRGTRLEHEYRRAAAGEARDFEHFYEPWGRWFHNRCFPREGGGMSVYFQDITERKGAEEALAASERKYRELLETANSIIIRWDNQGVIQFVNEYGLRFFGYSPEELHGRNVMTIVPELEKSTGRDLDAVVKDIVIHPEHYAYVPSENNRKDGKTVWVAWTNKAILNTRGEVLEVLAIGNDITPLKEAEDRLRASVEEKEVLLKEIHHRVKNNMQVISSLVALQADELQQDAVMREVLQDVTDRVRSMALVHEKLYQSADLARVEFSEYARSLLHYLWRAHGTEACEVRLTLDLEPVSLPVNAAVPCGLILNELVSNALKHAFRKRGRGEVSVSLRGRAQGQVGICVRDNGAGLPAGFDWNRSRSLGLRLVQMLAGQLHATVDVSGDKGTEFTITFGGLKT